VHFVVLFLEFFLHLSHGKQHVARGVVGSEACISIQKKKLLSKHKALTEEIQQTSFHKCWAPECLRRFAIVAVSLTLKRVMILKFMWKRLLNPAAAQQVTDFDDFDYS